jgi:putative cardiolipin synthase
MNGLDPESIALNATMMRRRGGRATQRTDDRIMSRFHPASGLGRGAGVLFALAVTAGCAVHHARYPRTPSTALQEDQETTLARLFEPAAAEHPGESGVVYMRYGRKALEMRLALADLAQRSLDLQYYIWDPDVSGHLLADRIIRAADRGVRVRVLLDDHSIVDRDTAIAQLSAHPNIEIRAFNPFRNRSNRWGDFLTDPSRANRRSHNKVMIADNTIMIVGGRNIADHYFGVHGESNYRDLDTVALGPVVRDASAVYDDFWNSEFAVPYEAFVDTPPTRADTDAAIAQMRAQMASERLPYPVDEEVAALTADMKTVRASLTWAPVRVLYDPPEKVEARASHNIFSTLDALVSNAQSEVLIENAYFVPRDHGVELTAALHARGVKVRVLTNSLASNDVVAVHSGYQKYRDDLLENGVEIYELRPDSTMEQLRWSAVSAKSRAGLHAKAMVVDRRYVVVGSYNLDPRSADINTELALLVDSPQFAEMVAEHFDDGIKPENSYRVTLERGRLRWTTSDGGTVRVYTEEPETSWWKRFTADALGILPIHSML